MQKSTITRFQGFEYFCETVLGQACWHFRPLGGPLYIQGPRDTEEFLALLDNAPVAFQFYMAALAYRKDVGAARTELARLQAESKKQGVPLEGRSSGMNSLRQAPSDPRRAGALQRALSAAIRRLSEAQRLTQLLADQPFDPDAWKSKWLP